MHVPNFLLLVYNKKIMFIQLTELKSDFVLKKIIEDDFMILLSRIGFSNSEAISTVRVFFELLNKEKSQSDLETAFKKYIFALNIDGKPYLDVFDEAVKIRAQRVYSEIVDFIGKGKVLDFGCGNGMIGTLLQKNIGAVVEGCDVIIYSGPEVTIPIHKFNGFNLEVTDGYFETGYANSVLHHTVEPLKVVDEITRVISKRFILIEDTLQQTSLVERDIEAKRLFINDYIYNRLLVDSDIPMPNENRTAQEWIDIFKERGWKIYQHDVLGWSKMIPAVYRERLIFEKQ